MKVKTLLPILGLTSVAVAAPIITSCAQAPKEKEKVVLDRWTRVSGGEAVRTKEYMDINTTTKYTFTVNWLRYIPVTSPEYNSIRFTLDHPGTEFDKDSIEIEVAGVKYNEVELDEEKDGYHFSHDGMTPTIEIWKWGTTFAEYSPIRITMKFKSPLKQVSPAIIIYED